MGKEFDPDQEANDNNTPTHQPNKQLKQEREARGWQQRDVAKKIGVSSGQISYWEQGQAYPSAYYKQQLCSVFERNAEELGLTKDEQLDDENTFVPEEIYQKIPDADVSRARNNADTTEERAPYYVPQQILRRRALWAISSGGIILATGVVGGSIWYAEHNNTMHVTPPKTHVPVMTNRYTYSPTSTIQVNFVQWSPDGSYIACALGDSTGRILNASDGSLLSTYTGHHNHVNGIGWSPDSKQVATASTDKTMRTWNAITGTTTNIFKGHTNTVLGVVWSPNGHYLATGSKDTTVRIWDAQTASNLTVYREHNGFVWNVEWSPDSMWVASCSKDHLYIWDPLTMKGHPTFTYQGPKGFTISDISWSKDSKYIATALEDNTVRIWDAQTGTPALCRSYTGHAKKAIAARWAPDSRHIASTSDDLTVQVWDAYTGTRLGSVTRAQPQIEVSWSPDNKQMAAGGEDFAMVVYTIHI